MKKIDKLIIQAFIGPFILTFLVVVFILLTVQMMNYVDEIFGKDLSYVDLGVLIFHFSVFQTPIAFPLSVMLASLITYGNLGEHFELTAIKGAGISLVRTLVPISIIVLLVTVAAFYSNNYFVPRSALKAYSLLYDIKQKKPALDIQPGQFYGGIENYMIKVDQKLADDKTLLGLTIYNHTGHSGNSEVIFADSGQMYTIYNNRYLKFELYNGVHYVENEASGRSRSRNNYRQIRPLTRTKFERSEMLFDLSSFGMSRTDEGLFASNRLMRNFSQLQRDMDSLQTNLYETEGEIYTIPDRYFSYSVIKEHTNIPPEVARAKQRLDSIKELTVQLQADVTGDGRIWVEEPPKQRIFFRRVNESDSGTNVKVNEMATLKPGILGRDPDFLVRQAKAAKARDSLQLDNPLSGEELRQSLIAAVHKKNELKSSQTRILKSALASTRQIKSKVIAQNNRLTQLRKDYYSFDVQWHKMLAHAIACISMFLIGAPLGAIIKRGGIGFPVLVSVLFFIIYYVISIGGEKYAKTGAVSVITGVWAANAILLPIGLFFLRQAKNDARLFEADFYRVVGNKLRQWFRSLGDQGNLLPGI
jgi:lipopolysaccharide export system permease protein